MAFVNLSLLFGGLLVAIPIALHLAMRQKPKHLEFPALRFLLQRRVANRQRLQLRHWLLLALRCAAICLLAAALARPSVDSAAVGNWLVIGLLAAVLATVVAIGGATYWQQRGRLLALGLAGVAAILAVVLAVMLIHTLRQDAGPMLGDREAPVAAVVIVDTSPRMQYRHRNATRLEEAKELASWLLKQLPDDSDVAVVDARSAATAFAVDRSAARRTIEGLEPTGAARPLADVLRDALALVLSSDKTRKEVYVLSDLTEAAWPAESAGTVRGILEGAQGVSLYIVDVGIEKPRNFALGDLRLSSQTISKSGELQISTELLHEGPGGDRAVELYVEDLDPELPIIKDGKTVLPKAQRRRRESLHVTANGSQLVTFDVGALDEGTRHGWVKIVGEDGLSVDDVRSFTVEVRKAWPVLVAAPASANATFLTEALAPYTFRETGRARFRCDVIPIGELSGRKLDPYAAVFLLDPTPLTPGTWDRLADYARGGGGVAVFLGRNARPAASFNAPAAQQVLPGKLAKKWRAGQRKWFLDPQALSHSMLKGFRKIGTTVPWQQFPIFEHWTFDELVSGSSVVIPMNTRKPALVERPLGKGRVLVMTTPISDPINVRGRDPWNWLPTGFEPWPFVILVNEMTLHLVGSGETRLNYFAGQQAVLRDESADRSGGYYLFTPRGGKPTLVTPRRGRVTVKFTFTPGSYRLKPVRGGHALGFSVNVPASASRLARATRQRLDEVLGSGRYKLARSRDEIIREQGTARVGQEFFPILILMLALVLGLEHTLANRFYRKE